MWPEISIPLSLSLSLSLYSILKQSIFHHLAFSTTHSPSNKTFYFYQNNVEALPVKLRAADFSLSLAAMKLLILSSPLLFLLSLLF
jgi:hypothetical protein